MPNVRSRGLFPLSPHLVITAVFVGVAAYTTAFHEMWRDELQAWRLTQSSASLAELFQHLRYEGHPALWYLGLYGLTRLSPNPVGMQVLHVAMATAAVYLLCRFAPFTMFQKVALSFGYYLLYEYAAISRNYSLGIAGLFAYCALWSRLPRGSPWLACLLALIINTNAYAAMIAVMLAGVELWLVLTAVDQTWRRRSRTILPFAVIVAAASGVALAQTIPPPDSSQMALNWGPRPERDSLSAALALIWKAYVPIPRRILDFWNTNVLDRAWVMVGRWHVSPDLLQAALSLGIVAVGVWVLARARIWLVLYGGTTAGLVAFMHVKYYAGLRHGGHLVILFVVCVWLSLVDARRRDGPAVHSTDWTGRLRAWGVTALVAAQIPAALMAVRTDIAHPFSRASDVAQYLRAHDLLELPIIASKYNITSSVALHVNRPVLYAELARTSTFIRWMAGRRPVSPAELLAMAEEMGTAHRTPVLLLTSYPLPLDDDRLIKLASFDDDAISDERYTIYLRDHTDAPSGLARSQDGDVVKSGEEVKREM